MADVAGYEVIPNAVPFELVQQAAHEIEMGLALRERRQKWTEFEPSQVCYTIRDKYMQDGDKTSLARLLAPKQVPQLPRYISVGVFHETTPSPSEYKTGNREQVYVTIALTALNPGKGLFIFLEGSHQRPRETTPSNRPREMKLELEAGDAITWRGDLVYLHSSGGGGMFVTLVFERTDQPGNILASEQLENTKVAEKETL